jgi:hypothetical protein
MTSYNTFDVNIQCEEILPVSAEEWEEVLRILAEECLAAEIGKEETGL